jgi:hypothetical protein
MYDMPFRDYDPAVARWVVMDPVVDYGRTPYDAHNGNPVFWADPSGAYADIYDQGSFNQWVSNVESDWAAIDAGANPFEVFFNRMMSDQQHNNAIKRAFNVLVSLFPGDTGGGGVDAGPLEEISNTTQDGNAIFPGLLSFINLTSDQLALFAVIGEDGGLTTPVNNKTYKADGFYMKNWSDNQYWFKISDLVEATVKIMADRIIIINNTTWITENIPGTYFGWKSITEPHWTSNPFDN